MTTLVYSVAIVRHLQHIPSITSTPTPNVSFWRLPVDFLLSFFFPTAPACLQPAPYNTAAPSSGQFLTRGRAETIDNGQSTNGDAAIRWSFPTTAPKPRQTWNQLMVLCRVQQLLVLAALLLFLLGPSHAPMRTTTPVSTLQRQVITRPKKLEHHCGGPL